MARPGHQSRTPEASMDVWNGTSSFASRMHAKCFHFPTEGSKVIKFPKISLIKNDVSVLGLTEQVQPVIGVPITHLHPPQIPSWQGTACPGHIQGCSGSHCPPALAEGWIPPVLPPERSCHLCFSPTPICMRIQDSELYLNFCTLIRFDWKITGLKVIKSNR